MAHSRLVNAFSRISKNYVFRFQIFCHIDLVLLYFCFRCGGGGGHAFSRISKNYVFRFQIFCHITMYSFKSEIQRQQCSNDAKFCAGQSLRCPTDGSKTLFRRGGCLDCPESSLRAHVILFVLSCSGSNVK